MVQAMSAPNCCACVNVAEARGSTCILLPYGAVVWVYAVFVGLGYDSASDDDSKQGSSTPNQDVSESSDEDSVQQRIIQKKLVFEQKMRQLEEHDSGE
jgi:hypothetical protein